MGSSFCMLSMLIAACVCAINRDFDGCLSMEFAFRKECEFGGSNTMHQHTHEGIKMTAQQHMHPSKPIS